MTVRGSLLRINSQLVEAKETFELSLDLHKKVFSEKSFEIGVIYGHLGRVLYELGEVETGIKYCQTGYDILCSTSGEENYYSKSVKEMLDELMNKHQAPEEE